MSESVTLIQFLDARIVTGPGCWLWTGGKTDYGYGIVQKAKTRPGHGVVHRIVYEMLVGPIPDGLVIDHLCRVRHCVNPDHMEPVTIGENTRRGIAWDRRRELTDASTTCRAGHPYTEANTRLYGPEGRFRGCRVCRRERQREKRDRAA